MRRVSVALVLVSALAVAPGCRILSPLTTRIRVCHAADDAWGRFEQCHECIDYEDDIRDGFKKGYKDFVMTNRCCPNPVLPCRYRGAWYQTCFGRHEVEAWREGYIFGQSVASQDCLHGYESCSRGLLCGGPRGRGCNGGSGCGGAGCGEINPLTGRCSGSCLSCANGNASPGAQCGCGGGVAGGPGTEPGRAWHAAGQILITPEGSYDDYRWESLENVGTPALWPPALDASPSPALPVPPAPAETTRPAAQRSPAQLVLPPEMPAGSAPAAPAAAAPSAKLELPAATATEIPAEDAVKDPPQVHVPARSTSSQRPVQRTAPQSTAETPVDTAPPAATETLSTPTHSARGPRLMQPDLNPPATTFGPATLDGPPRSTGNPPAVIIETPVEEGTAAEPDDNPTGRAAMSDPDPFSEVLPAPMDSGPNAGWKPLDWKPTRGAAGRPVVAPPPPHTGHPSDAPVFEAEPAP